MMQRSKTALVLAGGGIAGAAYEIGALCAIDEVLADRSVNEFDLYVGTSAGALVASCLANGLTPHTMLGVLERSLFGIDQLEPGHLFTLNLGDLIGRARKLPGALWNTVNRVLSDRTHTTLLDLLEAFSPALPSGLYDSSALERYLRRALSQPGRSNAFSDLARELLIVATDLDSGERAVFGMPPLEDIPISQAVCASAAIPLFYKPVRIGGRDYIDGGIRGTASLDVAIEQGAELIVCINPMVPFNNSEHQRGQSLAEQGVHRVGNQVFRTFIHAGLHYHIKQLRRRHPHVDIMLIEPQANDRMMFDENAMRYDLRLALARHAFQTIMAHLQEHFGRYQSILARHQINLTTMRIAGSLTRPAATDLSTTLAELDRLLGRMEHSGSTVAS
jgi:NTE family protein